MGSSVAGNDSGVAESEVRESVFAGKMRISNFGVSDGVLASPERALSLVVR